MATRQIIAREGVCSGVSALTISAAFVSTPTATGPKIEDLESIDFNKAPKEAKSSFKKGFEIYSSINPTSRALAFEVWRSTSGHLALIEAFTKILTECNTTEGREKLSLSTSASKTLGSKLWEMVSKSVMTAYENPALSEINNIQYPHASFKKSWNTFITEVGSRVPSAKQRNKSDSKIVHTDFFIDGADELYRQYQSNMEERNTTSDAGSGQSGFAFGDVDRKEKPSIVHPLALPQNEFRNYIIDLTFKMFQNKLGVQSYNNTLKNLSMMTEQAQKIVGVDVLVTAACSNILEICNPKNKRTIDNLMKAGMERDQAVHGLTAINFFMKKGLESANSRNPTALSFINNMIPGEFEPFKTTHFELMRRTLLLDNNNSLKYNMKTNQTLAEKVILATPLEALAMVYTEPEAATDAGKVKTSKSFEFVTGKLDDEGQLVMIGNKAQTIPVSKIDKTLHKTLWTILKEKSKEGAREKYQGSNGDGQSSTSTSSTF